MAKGTREQAALHSLENMRESVGVWAVGFAADCVLVALWDYHMQHPDTIGVDEIVLHMREDFGKNIPRERAGAYAAEARKRLARTTIKPMEEETDGTILDQTESTETRGGC